MVDDLWDGLEFLEIYSSGEDIMFKKPPKPFN